MKISRSFLHITGVAIANPAPATAPTIEWEVETGILRYVAIKTQMPAPKQAARAIQIAILGSSLSRGTMPFPTVFITRCPNNKAPKNEKTQVTIMASFMVILREPTSAPTQFAASLAPIVQPMKPPAINVMKIRIIPI